MTRERQMSEPAFKTVRSADGTPIACWRTGSGSPLVLVHGTAADHARWAGVLPLFEARHTVVTIDRRGRGGSGDAAEYAIEREFEDLAAVADWTGPGTSVLGHSYGAECALAAARLTENIVRLILYEPPAGMVLVGPDLIGRLEDLLRDGKRDALLQLFFEEVAGVSPEQVERMRSQPSWAARIGAAHTIPRELRAARDRPFDAEAARDLHTRTLLLQGGDSLPAFKTATEVVHTALPNSLVVVMPGHRHTAMDTGSELFTREVLSFLDSP
jgi:pimeloyl-ACP methyl ester carboxylesterase